MKLDTATLRSLVQYFPETGDMIWRSSGSGHQPLAPVGWMDVHGYRRACVSGENHLVHRLAWLYVLGEWPAGVIDHINGDPTDNRIGNLRVATGAQNQANRAPRHDNTSGFTGVRFHKMSGKWLASIQIGSFETVEEAAAARRRVAEFIWGEFVPSPDRFMGQSKAAKRKQRGRCAALAECIAPEIRED